MDQKKLAIDTGREIKTTSDMIVFELRQKIIDGSLPAGTQLKNTQLAEEFKTSITPVREALNRLEKMELAEYKPRCGWVVKTFDDAAVQEVYDIRFALEMMGAKQICSSPEEIDIGILYQLIAAYKEYLDAGDLANCMKCDVQMHFELVKFSKNRFAIETMDRLKNLLELIRTSENYTSNNLRSHEEHILIYEALRAKDINRVEELLSKHVRMCSAHFNSNVK